MSWPILLEKCATPRFFGGFISSLQFFLYRSVRPPPSRSLNNLARSDRTTRAPTTPLEVLFLSLTTPDQGGGHSPSPDLQPLTMGSSVCSGAVVGKMEGRGALCCLSPAAMTHVLAQLRQQQVHGLAGLRRRQGRVPVQRRRPERVHGGQAPVNCRHRSCWRLEVVRSTSWVNELYFAG